MKTSAVCSLFPVPRSLQQDLGYGAALLALVLLLWAPRLTGPIDLRYDAGVYYVLGTSLAQGRGYRLLNEPGAIEALQYPPLLPAFVAVHEWVLGSDDYRVVGPWLRRSNCLLYLVYVLAVYALARRYLAPLTAALAAAMAALYLQTIFLSDFLFAEVPFALATTLFVLCDRASKRGVGQALAGLCAVAAFLLRTAGVAVMAAWVAEGLLRRRWGTAALRAAVLLVPVLAWQAYVGRVTSSEAYRNPVYAYQRASYQYYNVSYAENVLLMDPFIPELGRASSTDVAQRVLGNVARMPAALGNGVMDGERFWKNMLKIVRQKLDSEPLPAWLALVPGAVVGCFMLFGLGVLAARGEWLVPLLVVASAGLICLTPWPGQFSRYLTPLTPFLAVALLTALGTIHARFGGRLSVRALCVLVALGAVATECVVGAHAYLTRGAVQGTSEAEGGRLFYYDEAWADFDRALAWLGERAGPGEIVATTSPHLAYLKTGLQAVMPPMEVDPERAQELLDSVPVTYLIVDELEFLDVIPRYVVPLVEQRPDLWLLVHSAPQGKARIYQRAER